MFQYKEIRAQLMEERSKTALLQAELEKANANIEYIAMMADIELDEENEASDNEN